jgi:hypothetical protein
MLTIHSNGSDDVLTQMLLERALVSIAILPCGSAGIAYSDLKDELLATVLGLEGVENRWELVGIELDCRTGISNDSHVFDDRHGGWL